MDIPLITIRDKKSPAGKILVEIDANRLERLAAGLGLFRGECIESIERAEKDYKAGRTRPVSSLKQLRDKDGQ